MCSKLSDATQNMESGDLKRLADILKSNPNKLLCNKTADCLKTVREGNAAYGAVSI